MFLLLPGMPFLVSSTCTCFNILFRLYFLDKTFSVLIWHYCPFNSPWLSNNVAVVVNHFIPLGLLLQRKRLFLNLLCVFSVPYTVLHCRRSVNLKEREWKKRSGFWAIKRSPEPWNVVLNSVFQYKEGSCQDYHKKLWNSWNRSTFNYTLVLKQTQICHTALSKERSVVKQLQGQHTPTKVWEPSIILLEEW